MCELRRSYKTQSRSYRSRHQLSSDFEEGKGERVSFLHPQEGNQPLLKLHECYRAVGIKYFKQIFFGIFLIKNLPYLASSYVTWTADIKNKKKDEEKMQEVSELDQLLRCFGDSI